MIHARTPTILGILSAHALLALTAGCNSVLVGSWKADPIPEEAPAYIAHANFKDDGTYSMFERNKDAEQSVRHGGQYQFDGFRLRLKRPSKKDLVYPAFYNSLNKTLRLTVGDRTQTLKKQ